jgi:hypothetical protein
MSGAWVAGAVRARALTRRRLGAAGARRLAACPGLAKAARELASTPYRHDLPAGADGPTLAALQHGVGVTLLWHLRVLAGWLPLSGADDVRVLAGGFEVANVDEQMARVRGRSVGPEYRLGALATAGGRVRQTSSPEEVRRVLSRSPWGDPDSADPWRLGVAMRLAWARRVVARVPEAAAWSRAAAALLLVREVRVRGHALDAALTRRAAAVLGPGFVAELAAGEGPDRLAEVLPTGCGWALDGVSRPQDLWRAEAAWHRRVERDGFGLLQSSRPGRGVVVGAVAVLAVDAWRVRAALASAARGGTSAVLEVFDEVA